jgi:hypothetical protein
MDGICDRSRSNCIIFLHEQFFRDNIAANHQRREPLKNGITAPSHAYICYACILYASLPVCIHSTVLLLLLAAPAAHTLIPHHERRTSSRWQQDTHRTFVSPQQSTVYTPIDVAYVSLWISTNRLSAWSPMFWSICTCLLELESD